ATRVPADDSGAGTSEAFSGAGTPEQFSQGGTPEQFEAQMRFERKLYVIRKRVELGVDHLPPASRAGFYIASLSSQTLIYKGMLPARQRQPTFPALMDPDVESALAPVHQRFSTNTFPSWPLSHPYRYIAHNGEINTLRGNINWMQAREGLLRP